jgi:electron transfer flavoprotein beta subunit
MHIAVLIKQTPDTTAALTVDASGRVSWGDAPLIVNPWDEFAIEESLRLKEKFGGKVTVITMGPESAKEALKQAVAMGCDEAVLLHDPAFEGSDMVVTATILAAAIRKLGAVDLVFMGKESVDGNSAQVPVWTAADLGLTPEQVGAAASAARWPSVFAPPKQEIQCEFIQGESPEEIARILVDRLLAEKVL